MASIFDDPTPAPSSGGSIFDAPAAPKPAAAPPTTQDLGTTALWNKPANVGWSDFMLAHLANAVKPLQGIADPHQNLNEALLLGSGLSGGASGFIPGVRERTAQAEQETPFQSRLALEGAGYLAGPGKLGIATRIGEAAAPAIGGWAGGVLGSAAEGAGASALGAAGAGRSPADIGKSALIGGIGGGALGSLGGVVGRGGTLPTSPTTQSYFDQAEQAYKPLNNILYDGKSVDPALDLATAKNAVGDLNGFKWRNEAPKTKTEIDNIIGQPQLSADSIHTVQKNLREIQGNPNANASDKLYAAHFHDQLQSVLENELPQTGVPNNLPPGVTPSNYAANVKAQGDFLTGQARDMERADVWKAVGGTPAGKDIGAQAGSWLADQAAREAANKPGVWARAGSPYNQAATTLAQTTGQPTPLSWYAKHFLLAPLAFTAAGESINALSGGEGMGHQPWWARMAEEGAAGLALGGGMAGYRAFTGASNVAEQQAAEAALRRTIASRTMQNPSGTYSPIAPIAPEAPIRDALRKLWFGQGAGGTFPSRPAGP